MGDLEKFKEQLPNKEKYYSSLTGKNISDKEYEDVIEVWNKFELKAMKDFHKVCLKCDVILFAVVEKFRNNSLTKWIMSQSLFECTDFKGCVCYIFASLFYISKTEQL